MDSDGLPIIGKGIDLKLIEALQHKRTLAYINHFLIQTTVLLNKFSCQAEEKLADVSRRTLQVQSTLQLLEAKLASIPELETLAPSTAPGATSTAPGATSTVPPAPGAPAAPGAPPAPPAQSVSAKEPAPLSEPELSYTPVCKDKRYAKFFSMVKVGVPTAALHAKMRLEGLDPVYLDNPDAPAPPQDESEGTESGTDSSFSD